MTEKRLSPFAAGFTLLELSLVLAVLGVRGFFFVNTFSGVDDVRLRRQSQAEAEVAREALRAFLLANKRLPCPDTNADGYENGGAAGCTGTGEMGTLPYLTLGLPDVAHNRMFYGVYRAGALDDGITQLEERTGDPEGDPGYLGVGDAITALQAIPAIPNTLDTSHIHIAGIDATGAPDCASGHNPAFLLIVPNADRNGNGQALDGINAANDNCFASPTQPLTLNYDDVVATESPSALIGWLTQHMN
jgi:prepilin-type N-terminal cleavage/methylation domain-containing protein